MELTPLRLTPLGLVHTIISVVVVFAAVVALIKDGEISTSSRAGRFYLLMLILTVATGLPIFRHGTIQPPHLLGFAILATLGVAALASMTSLFGRFAAYVKTVSLTTTVFFLSISTFTETLTRLPPSKPLLESPNATLFKPIYGALLVLFIIGVVYQLRGMRTQMRNPSPAA